VLHSIQENPVNYSDSKFLFNECRTKFKYKSLPDLPHNSTRQCHNACLDLDLDIEIAVDYALNCLHPSSSGNLLVTKKKFSKIKILRKQGYQKFEVHTNVVCTFLNIKLKRNNRFKHSNLLSPLIHLNNVSKYRM